MRTNEVWYATNGIAGLVDGYIVSYSLVLAVLDKLMGKEIFTEPIIDGYVRVSVCMW